MRRSARVPNVVCPICQPQASVLRTRREILSKLILSTYDTSRAVQLELSHHDVNPTSRWNHSLNSRGAWDSPRFSGCRILCCIGHQFFVVRAAVFPSAFHMPVQPICQSRSDISTDCRSLDLGPVKMPLKGNRRRQSAAGRHGARPCASAVQ